ncbi:MAG: bifunctional precorrin-2 dehydrogenase/sirohydrochlorin ferrochelatase [Firmicutes bacterium]|nr:bifunctional precorrin-2 dehydrogenase/sirohydrochlorin ferrochelatase [Bacillota bacterium]
MAFYPVLIEFDGASCLVAGGGQIALHKAKLLIEQGADVTVVAPQICDEIKAIPVRTVLRKVAAEDAEGKMLVVDASGSPEAEALLSEACRKLGIPCNCAGHGDSCTAMFPAVFRKGRTVVAVSSQGASPPASAWLRDELAARVPENMDEILERMAEVRIISRESFSSQPVRREYLHRCLAKMLKSGALLTDADELRIRETIKKEFEE